MARDERRGQEGALLFSFLLIFSPSPPPQPYDDMAAKDKVRAERELKEYNSK